MFEKYCIECPLRKSKIKRELHEKGLVGFFCSSCDASCYYDNDKRFREQYDFLVGAWIIETVDTKEGFIQVAEATGMNKDSVSINYYDGNRMKIFNFLGGMIE